MNLFKKVTDYKSDFTTYPKTFEGYRWYKPIAIAVLAVIIYFILFLALIVVANFFGIVTVESTASNMFEDILTTLSIALLIPSIYIPSRILKERPFSSYISSIGGWNWSIFFKSSAIIFLVYGLITLIQAVFDATPINNHFTLLTFVLCMIVTPFQCFAEEYLCRGFLMQTFGSWFKIPILAIILQALIFTVMHDYNIIGLIDIFISGVTYGLIAWYTKGLEVSSSLHTVNNIIASLVFGLGLASQTTEILMVDTAVSLATMFISVALIFIIERKYNWIGLS